MHLREKGYVQNYGEWHLFSIYDEPGTETGVLLTYLILSSPKSHKIGMSFHFTGPKTSLPTIKPRPTPQSW